MPIESPDELGMFLGLFTNIFLWGIWIPWLIVHSLRKRRLLRRIEKLERGGK